MNEPADEWPSAGTFPQNQLKTRPLPQRTSRSATLTQPVSLTPPGSTHYPFVSTYHLPPLKCPHLFVHSSFLACLSYIRPPSSVGLGFRLPPHCTPPADRTQFVQEGGRCRGQSECVPLKGLSSLSCSKEEKHVQVPKFWGWEELGGWVLTLYTLWVLHIK